MRKGENKAKGVVLKLEKCEHRVIIPLYIPSEEDYYSDAFEIFKMCLFSILKTSISPLKISVISNGCCDTVNSKLLSLSKELYIDELIIEKECVGKVNSVLKALRTANERFITITDADVLFVNNWEKEVLNVFKNFPKAGMVSPVPIFRTHLVLTSNIWKRYLFSKKLKFRAVKNPEAMTRFANSIGWPRLDLKFKDVIATLKSKEGTTAVVGSPHFVGTYKKEVFNVLPKNNSEYLLGGTSEYLYTDKPILEYDGYRLSTYDNYAFHVGNVLEPWMKEKYNSLKEEKNIFDNFNEISVLKKNKLNYFFSEKIVKNLFRFKMFKTIVFKQKVLTVDQLKNILS